MYANNESWPSYIIDENMCFLTLTEKNMSKRIIFSYLEDIKNTFIAYLQNENKEESFHSSLFIRSWRTALATMARPYVYARFGTSRSSG